MGFYNQLNYFLYFLKKILNTKDNVKLTIAPIVANKTVFKTSSDVKFGRILKKVPLAVVDKVELLTVILLFIIGSNLADSR